MPPDQNSSLPNQDNNGMPPAGDQLQPMPPNMPTPPPAPMPPETPGVPPQPESLAPNPPMPQQVPDISPQQPQMANNPMPPTMPPVELPSQAHPGKHVNGILLAIGALVIIAILSLILAKV